MRYKQAPEVGISISVLSVLVGWGQGHACWLPQRPLVKPGPASHCPAWVLCSDHIAIAHYVAGTCRGAVCRIYILVFLFV